MNWHMERMIGLHDLYNLGNQSLKSHWVRKDGSPFFGHVSESGVVVESVI